MADDDFLLARQVSCALERDNFYTDLANNGTQALAKLQGQGGESFDGAVLDINMPGRSGLEVLAELRQSGSNLPVLLLTDLTGELNAVVGFNAGADDYVAKPLRARELVARVRRLMRAGNVVGVPVTVGQGVFSLSALRVAGPTGEEDLSVTEANLLRPLLTPPGRLVAQAELLSAGWGSSDRRNVRSLYEHVRRIRATLKRLETGVDVRSSRNAGYRLDGAA